MMTEVEYCELQGLWPAAGSSYKFRNHRKIFICIYACTYISKYYICVYHMYLLISL